MPKGVGMNITWLILGIGLALLASRRFRSDFVVVATVVALQFSGALTLDQALAGFSNPAVITVAAFMILSYSASGIDWGKHWENLLQRLGRSTGRLSFWAMGAGGLLSSVIQEEQAVGMLMPSTIRAGRVRGVPPSKLLMPMAFGALLGRTMFLVGSPAALLVVWAMLSRGDIAFGVFDLAGITAIMLVIGMLFVGVLGHTVLPRKRAEADPLDRFRVRQRLRKFVVRVDSPLVGKSLGEAAWPEQSDVIVLGFSRTDEPILAPTAQLQLAHGDVLLAQINPEREASLNEETGLEPVPQVDLGLDDITRGDIELVEVVVRLESPLQGQTLREVDFRRRYGVSVLAIARGAQVLVDDVATCTVQGGDVLLIQGDRRRVALMLPEVKAIPLGERALPRTAREQSVWALGGVVVALAIAGIAQVPLLAAFLLMALVMSILTRYPTREAYRALDWPLLILLAGVIPWATAIETSQLSSELVNLMLNVFSTPNPYLMLLILFALVVVLATFINAPIVAVLMSPVVMGIAAKLGVNAQPFLITMILATSAVFIWPVGHRTHIVVQSTGGYIASDFARMGVWLVVLLGLVNVLIVPQLWPF